MAITEIFLNTLFVKSLKMGKTIQQVNVHNMGVTFAKKSLYTGLNLFPELFSRSYLKKILTDSLYDDPCLINEKPWMSICFGPAYDFEEGKIYPNVYERIDFHTPLGIYFLHQEDLGCLIDPPKENFTLESMFKHNDFDKDSCHALSKKCVCDYILDSSYLES